MAIYEAQLVYTGWPGAPGTNTMFAVGLGEDVATSSVANANAWGSLLDTYRASIRLLFSAAIVTSGRPTIIARNTITGEPLVEYAFTFGTGAGSGTVDLLPQASSLVVGWRTDLPARRGRGRSFLPPLTESNNEVDGSPTAAIRSSFQAAADTLITSSQASTAVNFVVWHRPVAKAGGDFRPVTKAVIRDTWGMLRSRRARV
jgi:hypothetical protein